MTPKEKAEELFNKYADDFNFDSTYRGYREQSKKCALIAVDEVLSISYLLKNETWFYNEVKKEIEKL